MGSMRKCSATAASRTPRARLASHPHGSAIPTIATMITLSRPGAMTKWRIRTRSGSDGTTGGHSLRVDLKQGVVERHGVYQARVPIRQGIEYRGYLWMKTRTFAGAVTIALEADIDGGRVYGETRIAKADGDWTKYTFTSDTRRERSAGAVCDSRRRPGHALDRSGLADSWRCRGRRACGRLREGQGAAPRIHPMAGRQRRAGLPLAMGCRPA